MMFSSTLSLLFIVSFVTSNVTTNIGFSLHKKHFFTDHCLISFTTSSPILPFSSPLQLLYHFWENVVSHALFSYDHHDIINKRKKSPLNILVSLVPKQFQLILKMLVDFEIILIIDLPIMFNIILLDSIYGILPKYRKTPNCNSKHYFSYSLNEPLRI